MKLAENIPAVPRMSGVLGQLIAGRPPAPNFDDVVLPHLDAAHRLAHWLLRNEHDAEDAVQEASLRAFRYFRTFSGGNGRAWFLKIVRNTCSDWRRPPQSSIDVFDEGQHSDVETVDDPETLLLQTDDVVSIRRAVAALPTRLRALLVLREMDGLSYKELADVMDIPVGTVMSRLSRARQALRTALDDQRSQRDGPAPSPSATRERRTRLTPAARRSRGPEFRLSATRAFGQSTQEGFRESAW